MEDEMELEKLAKDYIDDTIGKMNYDGLTVGEIVAQQDAIYGNNSYNNGYQLNNENLIQTMIDSGDISTRNMGFILRMIAMEFPTYLPSFVDKITSRITYTNSTILYKGPHIDNITLQCTNIVLRRTLSSQATNEFGVDYFNRTVIGDKDSDYEFYTLNSMLKPYAKDPDQNRLDYMLSVLSNCYEHGNKEETLHNMKKLVSLVVYGNLKIKADKHFSCFFRDYNTICLNEVCCSPEIALHELGHAMDHYFFQRDKNSQNEEILGKARENMLNNPKTVELVEKLGDKLQTISDSTSIMFDRAIIEKYGSKDNACREFENYAISMLNSGRLDILLGEYDVNQEFRQKIYNDLNNGRIDMKHFAVILYNSAKNVFINKYMYTKKEMLILDIFAAIGKGRQFTMKDGTFIRLQAGHYNEYFTSYNDASFSEIVADYNALIVNGEDEILEELRQIFGDEFMDFIKREHNTARKVNNDEKEKERRVA